jgi:hypothetical protein
MQHHIFTMKDYIDDLAAPIYTSSTSTNIHQIASNMPRLYAPPEIGVCAKSAEIPMPPWPHPIRLARTMVELESRATKMQEGEDDEDIATIDTTHLWDKKSNHKQDT